MPNAENVIPLKLTAPAAEMLIRDIAKDSAKVKLTSHARKRMRERRVSMTQVLDVLRRGKVCEGPGRNVHGDWEVAIRWRYAGDTIKLAVAIDTVENGDQVIVITVIKE